jgi:allantoate deiminase
VTGAQWVSWSAREGATAPSPAAVEVLERSRDRVAADIEELRGPAYTTSTVGITRHAYTPVYANTLAYFERSFRELGFRVHYDPIGTLVASNREPGVLCFGLGSHCDANRNGGPYDGTLGVVCALEVARLAHEQGLDLPLRVMAFLEEEGSGFGQMLLGSRVMLGQVPTEQLASLVDEHGIGFFDAARKAGFTPERHEESGRELDDLVGWIELHIEQGRLLQDTGHQIGVVTGIAGYVHGHVTIEGRADHAGGTPMDLRSDPLVTSAEVMVELERLTRKCSAEAVGTVGQVEVDPGLSNVIPGSVTFSLDIRSVSGDHRTIRDEILAFARERGTFRGQAVRYVEVSHVDTTPMDVGILAAIRESAANQATKWIELPSGAAHDTMLVARRVPAGMVFVPCVDGISHAPEEDANPLDAAVACQVILGAVQQIMAEAL